MRFVFQFAFLNLQLQGISTSTSPMTYYWKVNLTSYLPWVPLSTWCNCTRPNLPGLLLHIHIKRFSGCLTRIHLKFWRMRTDERVRSVCLVGVLPISTHDIDLMMNAQYSGLDFKHKACFNRPYLHACTNFLNVKQTENLCTASDQILKVGMAWEWG